MELKRAAHDFFMPLICSQRVDNAISMRTTRYVLMFNVAQTRAEQRLKAIDPVRWSSLSYANALPYAAAEVCDAMRAGATDH